MDLVLVLVLASVFALVLAHGLVHVFVFLFVTRCVSVKFVRVVELVQRVRVLIRVPGVVFALVFAQLHYLCFEFLTVHVGLLEHVLVRCSVFVLTLIRRLECVLVFVSLYVYSYLCSYVHLYLYLYVFWFFKVYSYVSLHLYVSVSLYVYSYASSLKPYLFYHTFNCT